MPQDREFELEVEYPDPAASRDENYRIMGVTMFDAAKLVHYLSAQGGQTFTWRYPNLDQGEYEVVVGFDKNDPPEHDTPWRERLDQTLAEDFGAIEVECIWTFREGHPSVSRLYAVIITFPVAEAEVRTRTTIQQEASNDPVEH